MKKAIIGALCLAGVCVAGRVVCIDGKSWWAEPVTPYYGGAFVTNGCRIIGESTGPNDALKRAKVTDAQIKALGESGRICEVYGHVWRGGTVGQRKLLALVDEGRGIKNRHCHICGKCESMSKEWK